MSLPSRERGLKSEIADFTTRLSDVAPLAGAWIEINHYCARVVFSHRRSPRGSVD